MRRDRRNRGLEFGVILLLSEMFNIGFNQIPPVTLVTIAGQVLLYIGYINVPWDKWDVCISGDAILRSKDYRRLVLSLFEHGDDMHLYYNMISFLLKGRSLENRYGTINFAGILTFLSLATSGLYVLLSKVTTELLHDSSYMKSCAIGFSGVIFALKVLTSYEAPSGTRTYIQGFNVPAKMAAWLELILIHLLVPNASFMGHLAGILAGLLYTSTPIGTFIDATLENLTGTPVIHEEDYYNPRSRRRSSYSSPRFSYSGASGYYS